MNVTETIRKAIISNQIIFVLKSCKYLMGAEAFCELSWCAQGRVGTWAQVGRDLRGCSCIPPSAPNARISTPDSSAFYRREMISDYSDQCQKTVTRGYKATVHKIPVEIITLKVLPFQLF